jgi:plasmid stabilization system protein ParE
LACDQAHLVTPVAAGLESIRDYVATDSPRYAALVVERIIQGVERLASFPESGRVVPERSDPQLREVIVRPYRVVYRLRPGAVEIATVFRASRMFPELK